MKSKEEIKRALFVLNFLDWKMGYGSMISALQWVIDENAKKPWDESLLDSEQEEYINRVYPGYLNLKKRGEVK